MSLIVNLSSELRLLRKETLINLLHLGDCTSAHLVLQQSIQTPQPLQRSYWLTRASNREDNLEHEAEVETGCHGVSERNIVVEAPVVEPLH